jgi:hypothetical protein
VGGGGGGGGGGSVQKESTHSMFVKMSIIMDNPLKSEKSDDLLEFAFVSSTEKEKRKH